jgi:hypothetical protein
VAAANNDDATFPFGNVFPPFRDLFARPNGGSILKKEFQSWLDTVPRIKTSSRSRGKVVLVICYYYIPIKRPMEVVELWARPDKHFDLLVGDFFFFSITGIVQIANLSG